MSRHMRTTVRLPDDLIRRIALDALGPFVPAADVALGIQHEDRVVLDPFDEQAESLFALTCGCHAGETWNHDRARAWWQTHLPELTVPLSVDEAVAVPESGPVVVS